jgi:hypothetical protein
MNGLATQNTNMSLIDGLDSDLIEATIRKINAFQGVIRTALIDGHDFGTVPGIKKPSLFKPGGEKICMLFGLNPEYEFLEKTNDYNKGFFSYDVRCTLYKNGNPVAQGLGNCNSKEKKYRWNNVKTVPDDYKGPVVEETNRWGQTNYKIENPDIYSQVNTILKMAKKRAFIDAVLQVASLSDLFTQDVEDMAKMVAEEEQAATASMTVKEASAVINRMTGKYKGSTLGSIFKNDRSYFSYLSKNGDNRVKAACSIIMESIVEAAKKKAEKAHTIEQQEAMAEQTGRSEPESTPVSEAEPAAPVEQASEAQETATDDDIDYTSGAEAGEDDDSDLPF